METLINNLFDLFFEYNKKNSKSFIIPLTDEEIVTEFASFNLPINNDIKYIYERFNGIDYIDSKFETHFFLNFYLNTLDLSFELYKEQCLILENWEKEFFPIFWDGNNKYILINLIKRDDFIYLFDFDLLFFTEDTKITIFDSFRSMIRTFIDYYQVINSLRGNQIIFDKLVEIAKQHNPNSEFWDNPPSGLLYD